MESYSIINLRKVLLYVMFSAISVFCTQNTFGQGPIYAPQGRQEVQSLAQPNGNLVSRSPQQSHGETSFRSRQNITNQGLTIQEVCEIALQNNPSVIQATRLMEAHYGSWVQAGLKNNPMVGYMAEEMGGNNGAGRQGVAFSQEHISRGKRDARQGAASAEYQAARQTLMIQRQKVVNDASLAGYRLLIAQQREYLAQELLKISESAASAADELVRVQESPKTDYLQARIERNRAQITLNDAVIERETAVKELAVLLGYPTVMSLQITDTPDHLPMDIDEDAVLRRLIAESPQLRQARAEWDAARARLYREQKEAGLTVNTEGNLLYNTYEKQTEMSVGVAIPLRINNRNQGNIMKAQSEMAAAARNMERVEKSLTAEFYNRFAEYKTARQRVAIYQEDVLSGVEESLQLMMQAYQHGQCGYIELLNTQRTLFNVKIEYLDSIALLLTSSTKIQGYLLEGVFDKPE